MLAIAAPAAARDCGEMAKLALDNGKVTSADLVAPGAFQPPAGFGPPPGVANSGYKNLPAFCRVQVTLTPTSDSDIKVEVWLPASGWNGKLVGIGNGVWAGSISYSEMGPTLAQGYAVVATDTGHKGTGLTAEWAVGHREKLVDFGYRAIHLMTVTAKAAIKDYYGSGPQALLLEQLLDRRPPGPDGGSALSRRLRRHFRQGTGQSDDRSHDAEHVGRLPAQAHAGLGTDAGAARPGPQGSHRRVRREGWIGGWSDREPAGVQLQGRRDALQARPERWLPQRRSGCCAAGHL